MLLVTLQIGKPRPRRLPSLKPPGNSGSLSPSGSLSRSGGRAGEWAGRVTFDVSGRVPDCEKSCLS